MCLLFYIESVNFLELQNYRNTVIANRLDSKIYLDHKRQHIALEQNRFVTSASVTQSTFCGNAQRHVLKVANLLACTHICSPFFKILRPDAKKHFVLPLLEFVKSRVMLAQQKLIVRHELVIREMKTVAETDNAQNIYFFPLAAYGAFLNRLLESSD